MGLLGIDITFGITFGGIHENSTLPLMPISVLENAQKSVHTFLGHHIRNLRHKS